MIGSLGATLSGITFPLGQMYGFFDYASFAFPIRYFVEIMQGLLYNSYNLIYKWPQIIVLLAYLMIPILLIPRFKRSVYSHKYDNLE